MKPSVQTIDQYATAYITLTRWLLLETEENFAKSFSWTEILLWEHD